MGGVAIFLLGWLGLSFEMKWLKLGDVRGDLPPSQDAFFHHQDDMTVTCRDPETPKFCPNLQKIATLCILRGG